MIDFVGTSHSLESHLWVAMETMNFYLAQIRVLGQFFRIFGGQMKNNPEGCMVDQIRSRCNCNFYLPLFSLIHDLDLIKRLI